MSDETPRQLHRSVAKTIIDMVDDEDDPKIYVGPAGKAPYSLGSGLLSEEEEDEEEFPADEEIIQTEKAYKEDYAKRLRCDEEYDEELSPHPDLASYFAKFDLPNFSVIAICRTYANYLAQQERSKMPSLLKVKKIKVRK